MRSNNYLEESSPSTIWFVIEYLCAVVLCMVPIIWAQELNQVTLTQGLIFASIFLVPSEFLRQFVGPTYLRQIWHGVLSTYSLLDTHASLHRRISIIESKIRTIEDRSEEMYSFYLNNRDLISAEDGGFSIPERIAIIEASLTGNSNDIRFMLEEVLEHNPLFKRAAFERLITNKPLKEDMQYRKDLLSRIIECSLAYTRRGNLFRAMNVTVFAMDLFHRYGILQSDIIKLYQDIQKDFGNNMGTQSRIDYMQRTMLDRLEKSL